MQGQRSTGRSRGRAGLIGERLRRYRRERGWTQKQLASRASLSVKTVSAIERGQERPLERTAQALASSLGVTLERLLGLEGQPTLFPSPDEQRVQLVRRVMELTDDEVERVAPDLLERLEEVDRNREQRRGREPGKRG